jgi:hypothetical protein
MSKLFGLAAVDWSYRCKYVNDLERSGRKRLADWEVELKNWNPDDEKTMPSGYAIATLREAVGRLN